MQNIFICTNDIRIKFQWINFYMYEVYLYVFFYPEQQAAYYWAEGLESGLTKLSQLYGLPFSGFNPHTINSLIDAHYTRNRFLQLIWRRNNRARRSTEAAVLEFHARDEQTTDRDGRSSWRAGPACQRTDSEWKRKRGGG